MCEVVLRVALAAQQIAARQPVQPRSSPLTGRADRAGQGRAELTVRHWQGTCLVSRSGGLLAGLGVGRKVEVSKRSTAM